MTLPTILFVVARVLLLYTFVAVLLRTLRRRDPAVMAPLPFLGLLVVWMAVPGWLRPSGAIDFAIRATLPLAGLLLVAHLRRAPRAATLIVWAVPIGLGAAAFVWGRDSLVVTTVLVPAYLSAAIGMLALVLAKEARVVAGVHRRRVVLAAVATGCLAITFASAMLTRVLSASIEILVSLAWVNWTIESIAMICFFLAFAPPRRLVGRWRRGEQATYLAQAADRDPEERGWFAAEDLLDGAQKCVGGALVVVARPQVPGDERLLIRASSDRWLVGTALAVADGLLQEAVDDGRASIGATSDCGRDVSNELSPYGRFAMVAPIAAHGQAWGVVLVIHRRRPLFPEDDLAMLVQLGRNAAVALEHAALIVERRERVRDQAETRLRELESRVGLMLDSIKDYAMLVLDEDGVVAAWHSGAQALFGYTREEITRASAAPLFDVPPAEFAAWLAEALERGKVERDCTCRRPDGKTFKAMTTIRPLVGEESAPPGFVVVTRDVTERLSLEERLHHSQKMQAIGQLAGGIAHDFNNLLTAIIGYADWLAGDMAGDPRLEQVSEIQRAAVRAADLTRQLLAFSRRQVVEASSLDLTRLVQELLPMLRRQIGGRIEIAESLSVLALPIVGDRSQVEQIIVNLVLNARDAMPSGGRITIRTSEVQFGGDMGGAGLNGAHVLLEVADTGVGMDEETRQRAFEPFFTTKEVGSGTGLGLATVYGTVQQMGGLIEVDSEVGRGTKFRIYLPHSTEPVSADEPPVPTAILTGRETVLIIEDDDALRAYLVHVLEAHGYHVIQAEGAEAALTVTETDVRALDLVISDIAMPGMSGPEVVAELAQMRPGLPALYISGGVEALDPCGRPGMFSGPLLQKPFSSADLLTRVRQLLSVS